MEALTDKHMINSKREGITSRTESLSIVRVSVLSGSLYR